KMEKRHLETRLRQMQDEGTRFRAGVEIGSDITWSDLRARYDAVVVATGATVPRDLPLPGRDLDGVHFAMEYLVESNKAVAGDAVPQQIHADGKHVIVIGGGDTGADCIGTAHRHGALSVTNLAIGKQPPSERPAHQPWPMSPTVFEVQSAHEEGGERSYLASTVEFLGNDAGEVRALRVAETEYVDGRRIPKSGTEREIPADLVLIAMGFTGPERETLEQFGASFNDRGSISRADDYQTSAEGVFVAGDAGRGQSLIVWAIAEGRAAAAAVDTYLMGHTLLPSPVRPGDVAIAVPSA
ncbi:FAD-dependent oxidoreductase, partial [Microbacterium sp.]|uniref:FAD-dependent oxidoreductase n=1 Tax=Microbacterium sp. TaxID=51671 RepID=UPI003A85A72D